MKIRTSSATSNAGRAYHVLIIATLVMMSGACASATTPHAEAYPVFRRMRAELEPLTFAEPSSTPTIRRHYSEASRGLPEVQHDTGTVTTTNGAISVHIWWPPERTHAVGTVYVVHGYLAHPLQHSALIRQLLENNYVVIAPELPGHALSDGSRGAIDDFSDYGAVLDSVTRTVAGHVPTPWHAVGHSTGATALYELIRRYRDPFEQLVFVAPLIRSRFYRLSRVGRFLSRPLIDSVSTGYDDPLGVRRMPLSWFDRQVEWNRRARGFEPITRPLLVLQGTADTVVAWRYNRRFIEDAFPQVNYRLFAGAGHVLFREDPDIREEAVETVTSYLHRSSARAEREHE
ncbi:MAG TPA: alpha/beta hydrolase [Alkalispirochaeta sp.]|nr:alpha/beta hydrolase [Alkalispirochaeta sp.]